MSTVSRGVTTIPSVRINAAVVVIQRAVIRVRVLGVSKYFH